MAKRPVAVDQDDPVKIPLDPVEALRALLKVDPDSEPVEGPQEIVDAAEQEAATPEDTTNEG